MDEAKMLRNIKFLQSVSIPLSEKLDKVINPRLITSNRIILKYVPDSDVKTPIDRPKQWISRIKKTSRIQSKTPKEGKGILGHLINRDGQTLLQQACFYGEIGIITKLIAQGADVNQEDWYGYTALLYAIKSHQLKAVAELLKNPELNIMQKYGHRHETALIKAIKLGYSDIVAEICRKRREVISKQDIDGRTPLFHAIVRGNSEMVYELIKVGSREKDLIDYKGINGVFLAIDQGEVNTVEVLLKFSEFDISESLCEKLLIMGCYGNRLSLVKSALPHIGINKKIRDQGLSPLLIAYSLGFNDITEVLLEYSMLEEVDYISNHGEFLLMDATKKNDVKMVEALVHLGCSLELKDAKNRTALHEASESGYGEIIKLLLSRSLDINCKDNYGNTPLMLAVKNGKKEIVEKLVRRGAEVEGKDISGKDIKAYARGEISHIITSFKLARRHLKHRKYNVIV